MCWLDEMEELGGSVADQVLTQVRFANSGEKAGWAFEVVEILGSEVYLERGILDFRWNFGWMRGTDSAQVGLSS